MSKNKHKNKSKIIKEEIKDTIPSFLKSDYITYFILSFIVGISLYIRAVIPWNNTFSNGITTFAMDDAVFHMRLVENLLANFPNRLTYDAFTNYPYGSVLSWGSLFDLIIGTLVIIFGKENINIIGALVPTIMGALVTIPVYFIGKELFNKKAGLFAAFLIAILPGAFLQRSTLGFTDNHVAEVLFSTTFLMFAIITFSRIKVVTVKDFISSPFHYIFKTPLKYSILAGIFLGLYILSWTTGLIISGLIAVYIIIQILINHILKKSNISLLISTYIIYGISAIMVIPFVNLENSFSVVYYSMTHIIAPILVIFVCTCLVLISTKMKEIKIDIYQSSLFILIFLLVFYFLIKTIFLGFFVNTFGSLWILFNPHSGGGITIAEAQPTTLGTIYSVMGINFVLSLSSLILLSYYFVKERKSIILLSVLWYIFILYALFAQNRFFYYFAINVAIFSGITCGFVLDHIGKWKNIKNINIWNVSSVICVIAIVGFSAFDISTKSTVYGVRGDGFYEWYESLTWMRNNTPDPGLDYYGTYERPNVGERYPYPDTAYAVMSWWDYGHIITYWAHRIPNANPFQSGIGTLERAGAAPFLIAPTEEEANKIIDELGSKYVVSNAYMSYSIQPVFAEWCGANTGYFNQVRTSQGYQILPSEKFYNTMESKLHIFDGNELQHYRLIHESVPNPYSNGGAQEGGYKQVYNVLINPNHPIPIESTGYVKVFEYVKGGKIVGKSDPNTEVTIKLNILTNINRNIIYTQKTTSDSEGNYVLIVPYSTTGAIEGGTQFDTKANGKYELSIFSNNKINTISLDINEIDILNGNTVVI